MNEMVVPLLVLSLLFCFRLPKANDEYSLSETYSGETFFDHFVFRTFTDPSHGTVDYSPIESGLAYFDELRNSVIIKVDNVTVIPLRGQGSRDNRKSIRIASTNTYNEGLFILDTTHIPFGCGTWPAYWLFGPPWPDNGEIDVLEQVHNVNFTANVLHTSDNCDFTDYTYELDEQFSGQWSKGRDGITDAKNCYINDPDQWDNAGCGIEADIGTFGSEWSKQNGGKTVMILDRNDGIRIWQFERDDLDTDLNDLLNGDLFTADNINIDFGTPVSYFPFGLHCLAESFNDLNIILNINLCGDWAGNIDVWNQNDCQTITGYSTCSNFVRQEPNQFDNAFWEINYLKIYQIPAASPTTASPTPPTTASPTSACIGNKGPCDTNSDCCSNRCKGTCKGG